MTQCHRRPTCDRSWNAPVRAHAASTGNCFLTCSCAVPASPGLQPCPTESLKLPLSTRTSPSPMPIPGTMCSHTSKRQGQWLQVWVQFSSSGKHPERDGVRCRGWWSLSQASWRGKMVTWKNNLLFRPQPCKRHPGYDPITWALGIKYQFSD